MPKIGQLLADGAEAYWRRKSTSKNRCAKEDFLSVLVVSPLTVIFTAVDIY